MTDQFTKTPRGLLRCNTCGRQGPSLDPWVNDCRAGHPFRCGVCGRAYPTAVARGAHHTRRHHRRLA
jgi:hypothetical protein